LEKFGYRITYLGVDENAWLDPRKLHDAITKDTILVSIMMANNEVGTILPIEELCAIAHGRGVLFHTDAVQAVGKIRVNVQELDVDMLSISGHKISAPKGIGSLYIRRGIRLEPLIHGGKQEGGVRAGTENVPGIVGLGKAAELAIHALRDSDRIRALRDRLETIGIAGYTALDKLQIARRHILPRQLKESGLQARQLKLPNATISEIITYYTREAGVRSLEREIASVARKTALRLLKGDPRPTVHPENLADYLGPRKFMPETANRQPEVGVATALAWTSFGGEILFIEALMMSGGKQLELTGQLGEVMKESALAALSFLRANHARLHIDQQLFSNCDIHLHVPSGATPKDGPSAGLALVIAMTSLFSSRPVRHEVAMTGEITLHGKVLPVGGIKEKVLAAHRAGITEVILPEENKKDLFDLPEEVSTQLIFLFVKHINEVLEATLLDG